MNKPLYLGQAILDISKTLMYEFWYDYLVLKYGDKVTLNYMDTDSFIIRIETEDFYEDIANDVMKWFDTSKYNKEDNRPLLIGKNKKVIGMFKDELDGVIMTVNTNDRAKIYAFKYNNGEEKKKAKGTKKSVIKIDLKFEDFKRSILKNETVIRSQLRFRNDHHNVFIEEVNKIAISSNDDKVLQTFDGITTYPYGTPAPKVCESQLLSPENAHGILCDRGIISEKMHHKARQKYLQQIEDNACITIPHKTLVGILTAKMSRNTWVGIFMPKLTR